MSQSTKASRVLVFEVNEISWELMQPWLDRGELPSFQRLREKGAWTRTWADEPGGPEGLLEPWVTWTTFYTGVPHTEHGVKFLEQPPETIRFKRLWEIAAEAGKKVGVFGSSNSWPPPPVDGFVIPGSFSPDAQTHPDKYRPIQDLNLRYTRAHAPGAKSVGLLGMAWNGIQLLRFGLNVGTAFTIFKTLVETKWRPARNWKKVSLQPIVNLPFFVKLYKKHRPDFATFHTNHVAHYQHRFFRARFPERFPDPTDESEISRFGDAIRHGYLVADRLLGRLMRLCERQGDVVLCVASSMGQKAYIPPKYDKVAPPTCRLRSAERLVEILGLQGRCEYFSTMAPQWNLRIADDALRARVRDDLLAARYQPAGKTMYSVLEVQDAVVLTPISHHGVGPDSTCVFPTRPGSPSFPFNQLVLQADETRKSGCHDPVGMLAFYGPGVRPGQFKEMNNLDAAPTLLTLLGVGVPPYMKGTAAAEAFGALGSGLKSAAAV
jgi:hypothetical protein